MKPICLYCKKSSIKNIEISVPLYLKFKIIRSKYHLGPFWTSNRVFLHQTWESWNASFPSNLADDRSLACEVPLAEALRAEAWRNRGFFDMLKCWPLGIYFFKREATCFFWLIKHGWFVLTLPSHLPTSPNTAIIGWKWWGVDLIEV